MKNNNEQFENFIRDFDSIRMTSNEKNEIYKNLMLFTRNYTPKQSPYFKYLPIIRKSIAMTLILFLIVTVSKPASAKSLPGDLLYNVKIIHEKIEAATISKPEDRVDFEIKRAETRIQEAVKLAKDKKLDATKQEKLANDIKKHVEEVSNKIEVIKEENPEKALALNSNLKTTLKINSKALEEVLEDEKNVSQKKENQTKELDNSLTKNQEKEKDNSQEQKKNISLEEEQNETLQESEEKETDALPSQENITEKNNYLDENKQEVKSEEESPVKIILQSIREDIAKAEVINEHIEDEIIADEVEDDEVDNETHLDDTITHKITGENIEVAIDTEIDNEEYSNEEIIEENNLENTENTLTEENTDINNENQTEEDLLNKDESTQEIINIPQETQNINEEETVENIIEKNEKNDLSQSNISESIESEITSLQNVLDAENRLNSLLNELSIKRDVQNIELVNELLLNKKLGQAYIEIQNEIEILNEIKLSKELGIEKEIQE